MYDTLAQRTTADSVESRVLKNTYTLLSATLLFTSGICWVTQDIALPPWAYLVSMIGSFGLLFAVVGLRNSAYGLLALSYCQQPAASTSR